MKKKINRFVITVVMLIVIFSVIITYLYVRENKISETIEYGELNFSNYLSTKDYIKVDFDVGPNFMVFKDKKTGAGLL